MSKQNITPEMLAKAKSAKSAEDLKNLAQQAGITLTYEKAREVFNRLSAAGELADDELAAVDGGAMLDPPGYGESGEPC